MGIKYDLVFFLYVWTKCWKSFAHFGPLFTFAFCKFFFWLMFWVLFQQLSMIVVLVCRAFECTETISFLVNFYFLSFWNLNDVNNTKSMTCIIFVTSQSCLTFWHDCSYIGRYRYLATFIGLCLCTCSLDIKTMHLRNFVVP